MMCDQTLFMPPCLCNSNKDQVVDCEFDRIMGRHVCYQEEKQLREMLQSQDMVDYNVNSLDLADANLRKMQEHNIPIPRQQNEGATSFIPHKEFKQTGNHNDDQVQQMYIEQFIQTSRLDHVTQVIGLHPKYLNAFQRTHNFMLRGDGPLSYDYRHYIAVLAAARHRCAYVVRLQEKEFLCQGGDPKWLESVNNIPQKLKDLYEVIKILAHQPWLITKEHIAKLLKGKDSWSLSELVHAIVIMAHFSALASFVFGCGINQEVDMEGGYTVQPTSVSENGSDSTDDSSSNGLSNDTQLSEATVDELMSRMKKINEQEEEELSQEEKVKKFENIGKQNIDLPQPSKEVCMTKVDVTQYVIEPEFTYTDFVKRGEIGSNTTFRAQDYAWEDHGYSLVNRLYPDIGPLLDEKFSIAKDLTYNTMGNKQEVDTSLLRQVIWIYIHSLFGIRHDDYDYGSVNQLMERSLKTYIKIVTCYPERTTKKDYDNFWRVFKHSEKVHVNIMILEARMQAELLYSLRAIMQYMT
ncbi:sestrin-1-like isoform X2 [Anneissia japonica]|uniref:sestrin-1-like isoform X2 n=1 Tax=Anneissia japonica TaxID=1529436 RepID=UPI0014256B88|nr:sestrin-1-like isoform X2 [Anneissia japonica]